MKKKIINGLILISGLVLICFSYNMFLLKNNVIVGEMFGLSVLAEKLLNTNSIVFIFSFNLVFLGLGLIFVGVDYAKKAWLPSLLIPVLLFGTLFLTNMINFNQVDYFIQIIFGGALFGFGSGLIMKAGFEPGGTDVIAEIVAKNTKFSSTKVNLVINVVIVALGLLINSFEEVVIALMLVIVIYFVSKQVSHGLNTTKTIYVVSKKNKDIREYLLSKKFAVTIFNAKGGKDDKKNKMLMCVIDNEDYYKVKEDILTLDAKAFITVNASYETANKSKALNTD